MAVLSAISPTCCSLVSYYVHNKIGDPTKLPAKTQVLLADDIGIDASSATTCRRSSRIRGATRRS